MGSSLTSYSLYPHKFILHVSTFNAMKDFLVLIYTLSLMVLHWVVIAIAQHKL
jgi:hypothetical protein